MLLNRDTAEALRTASVLRRWGASRTTPGGSARTVAGTFGIDAAWAPHLDAE